MFEESKSSCQIRDGDERFQLLSWQDSCYPNRERHAMTQKGDRNLSGLTQPYQDHILGPKQAKIQLLEYGDYKCPHCVKTHRIVLTLLAEFGEQMQFVFRHFPLTDINPHAQNAAKAAEAAGSQGKFWEMHNRLFIASPALDDANLVEYAIALRLNVNQFLKEITGDYHVDRIAAHIAQGRNDDVHSLPTFFINQQRFNGNWSQSELIQVVNNSLSQN